MAGRPKKRIDYAGWSVDIFSNDTKIDMLIDAQGWSGFGIYFYLCQMAFGNEGYFYEWGYALCATTARKMGGGVGSGTVKETVDYCLQIGLFDKGLFDRWGVLTSRGIQKSYVIVLKSKNRTGTELIEDYWLLDNKKELECQGVVFVQKNKGKIEVNTNSLRENTNSLGENDHSLKQKESKVKESKVNKYNVHSKEMHEFDSLEDFFETIWKLYPIKKGKGQISKSKKQTLQKIGLKELQRCIERFKEDMKGRDKKYWMHGSTFFNSGYIDYLDANYEEGKVAGKKANNAFNQFQQNEYDFDSLEKELLCH